MPNLSKYREQLNLTQEELAEKSGLSVRTIQRVEAGMIPKGYTLKVLSKALGIEVEELIKEAGKQTVLKEQSIINHVQPGKETGETVKPNVSLLKFINLSSLPFTILPPLNILAPLLIVLYKKEKNRTAIQILSIQILWTILAALIFMLAVFIRKWFGLDNSLITIVMFALLLCNIFIILKNAAGIARRGRLFYQLDFSIL